MTKVDMSAEAVGRRLQKLSQLRRLAVGLAGPRRRPMSRYGPFEESNEQGEIPRRPGVLAEPSPPYRLTPGSP